MYKAVSTRKSRVAFGTYKYALAFGDGSGTSGPVQLPEDMKDDDYEGIISLLEQSSRSAKPVRREWKSIEVRHVTAISLEREEIATLILEKNKLVQDVQNALGEKRPRKAFIRKLALAAAEAEGKVAKHFIAAGQAEDAVVNLVSQGSLLVRAEQYEEAREVLQEAQRRTSKNPVKDMIEAQLEKIEDK